MILSLQNRFATPSDGWIHLASLGEHPHAEHGIVQVVDRTAVDTLVKNFRGPAVLDFDHESHNPEKRTEAAGWIEELTARNDGLYGRVRFSDIGQQAVEQGRYRFVSPVWNVAPVEGKRMRPVQLLDAGLTNQPNLKNLRPLSNRAATPNAQPSNPTMKTVLKSLGLAEDATEETALAAVQGLQNRAGQADALTKERDTLLSTQVDADLVKFSAVIKNRDAVKAALLANRKDTLVLLESLQVAAPAAPITNRQGARPPAGSLAEKSSTEQQAELVESIRLKNRCTFQEAWNQARTEKPELFNEAKA